MVLFYFFLTLLLIALTLFLYLVLTEYKPSDLEEAEIFRRTRDQEWNKEYSVTTYNIGYCSNDKRQRSKTGDIKLSSHFRREYTFDNLLAITHTMEDINSDFYLLQEVDHDSARSSKVDQIEHFTSSFIDYNASFAYNFNAKYVPFPMNNPLGGTHSGLLTLSKYKFSSSERYQLDGQEKFPKSIFFLKRCMLINEYQVTTSKKLYLINIHISSYDKDNLFRTEQFHDMLSYINDLYDGRKNYIIIGGDFNYLMNKDDELQNSKTSMSTFPEELYQSKFKPVFDKKHSTMKDSSGKEYNIDGFIVSPNVKVVSCKIVDDKFEHSNHNPVTLKFKL